MLELFVALVLSWVVAPFVQMLIAWALVELAWWLGRKVLRHGWERVRRYWAGVVLTLRIAFGAPQRI